MSTTKATKNEIRFAAGTETGLRSTVWKLEESKGNIYLKSRMMGGDTKISLHKSGSCQFSFTKEWVQENIGIRIKKNADRHFSQWTRPVPIESESHLTFRLVIPGTELRIIPYEKKLEKVLWLPLDREDDLMVVDLYYTSCFNDRPDFSPYEPFIAWQLSDSSWFAGISHIEKITTEELMILTNARVRAETDLREKNIRLMGIKRSVGFFIIDDEIRGAFEMVHDVE